MSNKDREIQVKNLRDAVQAIHKVMNPDDPEDILRIAHNNCLNKLVDLTSVNREIREI